MMAVINAIYSNYTVPFFGTKGQSAELSSWAGDICDLVKDLKNYTGEQLTTKSKEVHIRPACPPILYGCKYRRDINYGFV